MTNELVPVADRPADVFTPEEVQNLHRHQFGPFDPIFADGKLVLNAFTRMHPFTCRNRHDGRHIVCEADLGVLIPTVRGWICQSCDYTQNWAHPWMLNGRKAVA